MAILTTLISHPLVSSAIGGLIGSVVSPWINWRIEKVRLLHESRRKKIEEWRKQLETANSFDNLKRTLLWEELKPYLSEVEQKQMFMVIATLRTEQSDGLSGEDFKLSKLLGIVAKIQKEWGIV